MFAALGKHRYLLGLLVIREVRIRYARAALGIAWALFMPMAMMAVFTVLNFGRLIGSSSEYQELPYSVFAYCGLLFWTHFATSLTQGTPSLVISGNLLKKCAFPREVIPLSKMLSGLLDLAIGAVFLLVLMGITGVPLRLSAVAVPFVLVLQLAFTAGLVLLFSAANLFFRDVNYLTQVGVVLGMFATSVIYPVVTESEIANLVLGLNPMSAFLDAYREALLLGRFPGPGLWVGALGAVAALLLGVLAFHRMSPRFAEEV
jgi:ABC-type polysaccharide/polyol phosphate export permease